MVNRRAMLLAAGTTAVAAVAGARGAQGAEVGCTVAFEGDKVIPEGVIELHLDGAGPDAPEDAGVMRVESDGRSRRIDVVLSSPGGPAVSSAPRIVARLERADGWLLARGSARVLPGSPVRVVLRTVMY